MHLSARAIAAYMEANRVGSIGISFAAETAVSRSISAAAS